MNHEIRERPFVSVVIPCRNEEAYIGRVLKHLEDQEFQGAFEVVIVDAASTDGTIKVVEEFKNNSRLRIRIISNPKIIIPVGMNLGIKNALGEIIIRMDGHAVPEKKYIKLAVETLMEMRYDVVGGICISRPADSSLIAKAVSIGISNLFGVGDSRFRLARNKLKAQLVDTVPFGCFRKQLWETLGGYDETLLINEDYDFNYRVRKMGGTVFLNPQIVTDYYGRKTLIGLAGQYYRYGKWKLIMLKKQPRSIRWRHAIPPLFVLSIFGLVILSFFSTFFGKLLLYEILGYFFLNIVASFHAAVKNKAPSILIVLPLVFFTMHISWGGGMLIAFYRSFFCSSASHLLNRNE
jgi:succinoglycan biosynthesis protein ExoA